MAFCSAEKYGDKLTVLTVVQSDVASLLLKEQHKSLGFISMVKVMAHARQLWKWRVRNKPVSAHNTRRF